jgi:hypothetical protein
MFFFTATVAWVDVDSPRLVFITEIVCCLRTGLNPKETTVASQGHDTPPLFGESHVQVQVLALTAKSVV